MDDKADVRLVDAHAEGDGGADHADFIAQKGFLVARALRPLDAGVIRQRLDAVGGQFAREVLGGLAGHHIDNAAFARSGAEVIDHLIIRAAFADDAVGEVGPVETGNVGRALLQMELLDDVLAHAAGGGGGERHDRHAGKKLAQGRNLAVFGTEIMAPFADTMRLVNGEEGHVPLLEVIEKAGEQQAFRGNVEQPVFALVQPAQTRARFAGIQRGVQEGRRHAGGLEGVHLVLHQRDEGGDDHGEAGADQGGELKAERFAAAGG